MSSDGAIDVRSADGVAVVTINRPAKRNAMTAAMCSQLAAAWQRFRDSDDRVAVLTGAGDMFCAGADLNDPPPEFWRALPDVGIDIGKPVISAVRGPAVGFGLGMVVFSDLCVAAEDASFFYPEAQIGISKGLMPALSVRVPHKVAMEIMLLGERVSARRGYEAGLVNRVVPADRVMDEAMRMAGVLSRSAPLVVRMLRSLALQTIPRSPVEAQYRAQLEVETVVLSRDAEAGLAAFGARRAPVFTGR